MNNVLAIAQKELRSYFSSPIGYVLVGLFALLFGWFFYNYLAIFVRNSEQMMMGGQTPNINQHLVRGVLLNSAVIILFLMPMITMRTYSEEKRSGTIELLLTSPLSDAQIILGKFLGAMGLYAAMLGVTLLYMLDPLRLRQSRMETDRGRLPRAPADGRLLRLHGIARVEPDEESDRRRRRDLRAVPLPLGHQLDR